MEVDNKIKIEKIEYKKLKENIDIYNNNLENELKLIIKNIKDNKIKKLLIFGNKKTGKTEIIKYIAKNIKKDIYSINYFTLRYSDIYDLQKTIHNIFSLKNNIIHINICDNILSNEELLEYINYILFLISKNDYNNIFIIETTECSGNVILSIIDIFDYFIKIEEVDNKIYVEKLLNKYNIELTDEQLNEIISLYEEKHIICDIIKKLSLSTKENYNNILNRYKILYNEFKKSVELNQQQ